ncbi:MAG: FtsX-like permease family protein [Luteitalea sp.]|nr:FtsX-like permease family protein [Luteitalea sp.]
MFPSRVLRLGAAWAVSAAAVVGLIAAAERTNDSSDELPTVLLSRQLLESETLRVGDEVQLSADPSGRAAQSFRIAGVYEPMPDPMRLTSQRLEARLHLPDLLALTSGPDDPSAAESVTAINVSLRDPSDADAFARDLSAKVPGLLVRPIAGRSDRAAPFLVLERFHLAIAVVTMIGSAIFLLALMVMLAEERRETFGILRLIGISTRRVLLQVMAEGLLIAVVGAMAGLAFAWATEGLFNRFFQAWYDTSLVFLRVTPAVAGRAVLLAVPLGVLASLAASWTLLRRNLITLVRR